MKADIAYANSKGIEVGGYDLIVWTREVSSFWMDIGGSGACIASGWSVTSFVSELTVIRMSHSSVTSFVRKRVRSQVSVRENCGYKSLVR